MSSARPPAGTPVIVPAGGRPDADKHGVPSLLKRALGHRSFVLGAFLTALLLFAAGLSLVWTPWSPYEIDMAVKLQPPSAAHRPASDALGGLLRASHRWG